MIFLNRQIKHLNYLSKSCAVNNKITNKMFLNFCSYQFDSFKIILLKCEKIKGGGVEGWQ